jgi:hypothetical protein
VRHLLVAGAKLARLNWICNLHSIGPEWINGNRWRALLLSPSLRKTDRSPPWRSANKRLLAGRNPFRRRAAASALRKPSCGFSASYALCRSRMAAAAQVLVSAFEARPEGKGRGAAECLSSAVISCVWGQSAVCMSCPLPLCRWWWRGRRGWLRCGGLFAVPWCRPLGGPGREHQRDERQSAQNCYGKRPASMEQHGKADRRPAPSCPIS